MKLRIGKNAGMRQGFIKKLLAGLLAGLMLFAAAPAGIAHAETSAELQQKLDEAKKKLTEIYQQVEAAGEALNETESRIVDINKRIEELEAQITQKNNEIDTTQTQIETTQHEIETKQAELAEAQRILARRVSASYKAGSASALSTFLSSNSFEDFVSRIYYAAKVSDRDSESIQRVKDLKADLEHQKTMLEEQKAQLEDQRTHLEGIEADVEEQKRALEDMREQQKEQKRAFEEQSAAQAEYISALDQAVKDKIAEEEEAARRAAEEAARRAAAVQFRYRSVGSDITGLLTDEERSTIVSAAYSQLGVSYLWGGESPGYGLDCSGLAQWCYAQAGRSLPHSSRSQCAMTELTTNLDELAPGDLVYYARSDGYVFHVAIYIGNAQVIEEIQPFCKVSSVYNVNGFVGGGTPI
ncbi:MAG: C40 family peptidase [Atopobiaceae bacterium]|nr:C40 family peptidase [Atopobiaceae bacterium]